MFEEHVPERLLDVFIQNNNQGGSSGSITNNLIEAVIEESIDEEDNEAESVQLSASFVNSEDGYEYNIKDLDDIENKEPTFIQITKVPQHGNIVVKRFGEHVVLNQGDFVETEQFKNFTYD